MRLYYTQTIILNTAHHKHNSEGSTPCPEVKRRSSMTLEQIRAQVTDQQKKIATLDAEITKLDESIKTKRKERNKLKINLKNTQMALEVAEAKEKEAAEAEARKADAEELIKVIVEKGLTLEDIKAKL